MTWILAGEVIGALGAVASVRLLTSVMSPPTYGEFTLGLTVAILVSQTVLGPLASACARFYAPARESGKTSAFFGAIRKLSLLSSVLILACGVLASLVLVLLGHEEWWPLAVSAVLFALLSGCEAVLDALQNAARQRRVVAWHQGLRQWLRPAMAVILLTTFATGSGVALFAYALASLVVLASQLWFLRVTWRGMQLNKPDGTEHMELTRQMLDYAAPFSVWGLFTWLQVASDRWALQLVGSREEVGLYAILLQLGFYPLSLLGTIVTQFAAPIVFAQAGQGTNQRRVVSASHLCSLLAAGMLGLTVVAVAGAMLLYPFIFSFIVGPEYRTVSSLLPLAVLVGGLFNVGQVLALVPMVLGDSRALLAPKIGTAVLAVLLNVGGAYLFGIPGVLVAGLLFALSYVAWIMLVARRLLATRTSPSR